MTFIKQNVDGSIPRLSRSALQAVPVCVQQVQQGVCVQAVCVEQALHGSATLYLWQHFERKGANSIPLLYGISWADARQVCPTYTAAQCLQLSDSSVLMLPRLIL